MVLKASKPESLKAEHYNKHFSICKVVTLGKFQVSRFIVVLHNILQVTYHTGVVEIHATLTFLQV